MGSLVARFLGIRGFIALGLAVALAFVMWRADTLSDRLNASRQTIADLKAASQASQRLAEQQKEAYEARYREIAERASHDHQKANQRVAAAANRYIADNRVCPDAGSAPGSASAASEDHGAGVPAPVSGDSLVVVSESDVRACSAAAAYAVSAHEFAVGLAATK